jgi:hypothetical protein
MLAQLRERTRQSRRHPEPAPPVGDGPPIIALAHATPPPRPSPSHSTPPRPAPPCSPLPPHADEREAHVREIQRYSQSLPEDSCGRHNRQAIAARLRAIQHAYRAATERGAAPATPEPTTALYLPQHVPDREIELE